MLLPFSDVELTGVEAGARPVLAEVLKICAQENDAAGICRIVLQGTVRVTPLTVTVPPQRTGSSWGHMFESSVAAWMKPRMSKPGVGGTFCWARALPAQSRAATSGAMTMKFSLL